jgi:hypothetical protein
MVNIALETQNRAPPDALLPAAARIPSSYNTALETVSADASHADKSGSLLEGASRGNILGDRGVIEKATRLIDTLAYTYLAMILAPGSHLVLDLKSEIVECLMKSIGIPCMVGNGLPEKNSVNSMREANEYKHQTRPDQTDGIHSGIARVSGDGGGV